MRCTQEGKHESRCAALVESQVRACITPFQSRERLDGRATGTARRETDLRTMHRMERNQQISALLADIPQLANALGHAAAPITLEYFGDLQCPYCRDFSLGVLPSIIERWVRAGTLRVEYRALETATREPDVFVAQQVAVLAAGKQVRAWHFVETFYDEQGEENSGYVTDSYLHGIASQIEGLNLNQWTSDRGDPELMKDIASDEQAAENASVRGTPSFLIGANGGAMTKFSATDSASFDEAIERLVQR